MTAEQHFGVSFEELKASDVMGARPDPEAQDLEQKIKDARKSSTIQIKLSADEVIRFTNEALKAGVEDWKTHFRNQVHEKIISQPIGSPKITAPSGSKAGLIKGPSEAVLRRTNNAGF